MARLVIEDVTINKSDKIDLDVRFPGGKTTSLAVPVPPTGCQTRQTDAATPGALDRFLDEHTDAQTAELLNRHGHFSGTAQPFTPRIVLHYDASTGCRAISNGCGPKGSSPYPKLLLVSVCTPPPSRPGTPPACLSLTRQTTRT